MSESFAASPERLIYKPTSGRIGRCFRHFAGSQFGVRHLQRASLLGALTLLQLAGGAMLSLDAAIGPSVALLTLLALWAVFGPERIALRLPATLWLAAAHCMALLYGEWRANGLGESAFLYLAAWLLTFAILYLPLWFLRTVGGWRFKLMASVDADMLLSHPIERRRAKTGSQFGTRDLLVWMTGTAILLGVLQRLMTDAALDIDEMVNLLPDAGLGSLMLASTGMSVIVLSWIILVAGRQPLLRWALAVLLLATLSGGLAISPYLSEASTAEFAWIESAAMANGLACITVIAACGYRLRRRRGGAILEMCDDNGAVCLPLSRRRLALGVTPLLMIAAVVACAAPQRLEEWHRTDLKSEWQQRGFEVWINEDGTLDIGSHIYGAPVSDDTLQRIARVDSRGYLSLDGAKISDTQLAILAPMVSLRELRLDDCELTDLGLSRLPLLGALETLNLMNTPITDAGLARLINLPNLQSVWLDGSEVTDEGILILARLPKLRWLTVSFTAVTETGAKRFAATRPDVDLVYGACDRGLGRWLMLLGHWTELYQGIGPCRPTPTVRVTRLHLRGTMRDLDSGAVLRVTDAALAALADLDDLEELDLRDTDITDRGLQSLTKHAALKRLNLRGTSVSEQAVAELSVSLPDCQILAGSRVN
jgi:hypothetical protein